MKLQNRIDILVELGKYLQGNSPTLQIAKDNAHIENGWFIPQFVNHALNSISQSFLQHSILQQFAEHYKLDDNIQAKLVGIVMAGNIPLVGFHDFLCVFLCGHKQKIKLSSKDSALWKHIFSYLQEQNADFEGYVETAEILKGCNAYIATGSNNSGRYFEQYFGKYPSIIRKNRTSVAVLNGNESEAELKALADDIHLYFGLGCRNVTKIYVPQEYDFVPLLKSFDDYRFFADHNKYKNNFDYQLSLALLNNIYYMTNDATLLIENEQPFSAISQLNYQYYNNVNEIEAGLEDDSIQCILGQNHIPFGVAQKPKINQFADGVDTMQFLLGL